MSYAYAQWLKIIPKISSLAMLQDSQLISNTVLRLKKIKERGISSFFKLPMYPIFAKSLMSQSGFVDVVQLRENPDF